LGRIKHDVGYYQLNLGTLTGDETEQLAWALLEKGESADETAAAREQIAERISGFSRWLFKESDGQPFFLVETLRALAEEGVLRPDPESRAWELDWPTFTKSILDSEPRIFPGVRERIRAWLSRVSPPADEILTAAAVLGEYASFDHLREVANLEEGPALAASDELVAKQLLQEVEPTSMDARFSALYRFSHQKLAEVAYQDAGAARRRILHHRAYEVLRAESVPAAVLAHHASLAGRRSETIQPAIEAGQEAMRMLAVQVAISHYETAWHIVEEIGWPESLSPNDRRDLYAGLGRGYELAGAWEKAQELYEVMIADARSSGSAPIECEALNHLATVHINGFKDPESALPLLQSARNMAKGQGDQRGMAETEWNLSVVARMVQDSEGALHHGEAALATARELENHQLMARCLNALAYVHARARQWDRVGRHAAEASELYAQVGNRILEADSLRLSAWSQLLSGRLEDPLAALRTTHAFSQQIADSWGEAESAWRLAGAYLELGNYGQAIELAARAAELARIVGQPTMVELSLTTLGTVQRRIMAFSAAKKTLEEILEEIGKSGSAGYEDWPFGELCAVHAMTGDWDQALPFAMRALQVRKERGLTPMGLTGWHETEALLRGAQKEEAVAELDRLEGFAAANKRLRLSLLCSRGIVAEWDRQLDQAVIHWNAAATLAREIRLPGEEWPILARLAGAYDKQGDHNNAREARKAAAAIILHLADTIDNEELREGFISADVVRSILVSTGTDEVQ
jgi:tetratricopeptide (TPR) repeat protein